MDPLIFKIILLLIMILVTCVFGLIPIQILKFLRRRAAKNCCSESHSNWPSLMLCMLSCFSAGVFLSTCFLHLLPEVSQHMENVKKLWGWDIDYPVGELLACAGFFLVFVMEEVLILALPSLGAHGAHVHGKPQSTIRRGPATHIHLKKRTTKSKAGQHETYPAYTSPAKEDQNKAKSLDSLQDSPPASEKSTESSVIDEKSEIPSTNSELTAQECSMAPLLKDSEDKANQRLLIDNCCGPTAEGETKCWTLMEEGGDQPADCGHVHRHTSRPGTPSECMAISLAEPERCELNDNCQDKDEDPPILMTTKPHAHSHGIRSITLVVALGFHSILEGLAFGVQNTKSQITLLFLCLIIHKCIVAFSVGLQLARTHAHQLKWVVASIALLALMTPIGGGIGMVVSGVLQSRVQQLIVTVFEGLAVGTFLYVTFFEILLNERNNEHPNLIKIAVMLVGFSMIGALRLLGHGHGHEDEEVEHIVHSMLFSQPKATMTKLRNFEHDHDHN